MQRVQLHKLDMSPIRLVGAPYTGLGLGDFTSADGCEQLGGAHTTTVNLGADVSDHHSRLKIVSTGPGFNEVSTVELDGEPLRVTSIRLEILPNDLIRAHLEMFVSLDVDVAAEITTS